MAPPCWRDHLSSISIVPAVLVRLRRLRCIHRSLDSESAATLVHAFVSSCLDYCNAVFAAVPKNITDRLQRVLDAAACVVSDMRKFDHGLSRLMHTELHWLDVPDRVKYKLDVLMYRCQHNHFAILVVWDHHVILTHGFKLVSFFYIYSHSSS